MMVLKVRVVKENDYDVPVGTTFPARRKCGDGSPYPIDAGRYQFKEDEVEIIPISCPECGSNDLESPIPRKLIYMCQDCGHSFLG